MNWVNSIVPMIKNDKGCMNDRFSILPIDQLLSILLRQYESKGAILGISKSLFYQPDHSLHFEHFNKIIESPIGVAAGPHTQLTQNIVASWLTGARFIELKTIQTLDELSIAKPCIDMQDEGYNCEWSQELKVRESFDQYLDAWILIHILRHKLFGIISDDPGMIFNMSVGYDMKGIMQENVQLFLDQMVNASPQLEAKLDKLKNVYPEVSKLLISPHISDNITLSTMHGCPPEEIGKIGEYLVRERKLHTVIKLNPTLLGKEKLHKILQNSGFETDVPDIAFEHDLKYADALKIIRSLQKEATKNGVTFGIKLTNTLESRNNKSIFEDEQMMYMSGRALHPISTNLAAKLQGTFKGTLNISFSGGANADNICNLYQAGLAPITVCTDLLKPGGYGRMTQYISRLRACTEPGDRNQQLKYLEEYAAKTTTDKSYKRTTIADINLKTGRTLAYFDCIAAPCVDTCPTHQDIPSYLHFAAEGEFDKAYQVIRDTNPFPLTTGMICDHLCQTKCVRIHYDSPVLIREVKRFVAEYCEGKESTQKKTPVRAKLKASVIGAGPSGLSCAYYLAKNGMEVTVYESKTSPGGMISGAIPSFRLTDEAINLDIDTIKNMGVTIEYETPVDNKKFKEIRKNTDFVFIGAGAQKSASLNIKGFNTMGILDPLEFLFDIKAKKQTLLANHVVIIGGGNTAMDAARTAWRVVGKKGKVTIVYRRTIKQMPADQGEIKAVLEEGIEIIELCNPVEVKSIDGQLRSIRCQRMQLGEADRSGRPRPVPIDDEFLEIPADTLIPAIGQEKAFDFIDEGTLNTETGRYKTNIPGVYIGGDALRGASTAINAIGDGRKAAAEILKKAGIEPASDKPPERRKEATTDLMLKKTVRIKAAEINEKAPKDRCNFEISHFGLDRARAMHEASRCLKCDEICNLCTTVCPNMAFHSYEIEANTFKNQQIIPKDRSPVIEDADTLNITQRYQILHIADWCNECGNCTTFCPTAGAPYRDKPHLYLDESEFHREKDGYFFTINKGMPVLRGYQNNRLSSLTQTEQYYQFESNGCELILSKDDLSILKIIKMNIAIPANTRIAVTMHVLLQGAMDFYQYKL